MQQHGYRALIALSLVSWPYAAAHAQDSTGQSNETGYANGEIIVTAQRREERALDVPISLTAMGDEQLAQANIETTNDLALLVPGMRMERIGIYTQPSIRGITTVITGPGADANVATYLDGVYQPSNATTNFELPDVERVEVLKGPQGTLFGRNATGGAIQVFTKRPSYTPTGSLEVSYGNYNDLKIKGFASGPLVPDKIAISLAASYGRVDNYNHSIIPGDGKLPGSESYLIRGKLLFDLSDNFRVLLTGRYSQFEDSLVQNTLLGNSLGKLFDPDTIAPLGAREIALNTDGTNKVETYDFNGRIEWDTDFGTLTSLTAYTDSRTTNLSDADGTYQPNGLGLIFLVDQQDDTFSQEVSFASDLDGKFNFVIGTYYTDGSANWSPLGVSVPGFAQSIYGTQKITSWAGFGELYFDITDQLSVIGGLRYSWEKRKHFSDGPIGDLDLPKPASLTFRGQRSWDDFTPRISLKYALTPRDNIYFTFSQGFKSGTFNTTDLAGDASDPSTWDVVDPEKITGYEFGYKGNPIDGVSLNAAVFYYDYKDIQQNAFVVVGGLPLSRNINAASARIYGFEADANIAFSPAFDMRLAVSVLDAKFKDFDNAAVNVPVLADPDDPFSGVGNTSVSFDASGNPMVRAPDFSVSVTPHYNAPLMGGEMDMVATLFYQTRTYMTFDKRISVPAHAKLNARVSWSPDNSGFTFSVFGRNLTNKDVLSGAFPNQFADVSTYEPPRTYGASVKYEF